MKPLSLRKATSLGFALIVALFLGNLLVSLWNTEVLLVNEHRVVYTQTVLTTLEEILARVTEAETSERGFLITGDADYLHSYELAVDRTHETLKRMKALVARDRQRLARIETLENRIRDRFDELKRAIAAQQAEGFDAAKHSVSTNHGRRLMNEMRTLVAQIQREEREALAVRSAESTRRARVTRLMDIGASLLGVSVVGLAYLLFRRELAHRQRADEAVRRLAAMVESSEDAILGKSLDGFIQSWNAGARRIYGYTAEEVVGRPVTLLCPPERADEVGSNLELVKRGVHIEHFQTTRVRKDGRRIDISLSISPIKDASGEVIGASAIARDITERKLLERAVLEIAAREQQRIGQDLHDGTGQQLTGLAMMAERLVVELTDLKLPQAETAARIVDALEQALSHVRALSKGLVPVELDSEGLMVALADLAARTSRLHAVTCAFRCEEPVRIRDNQTATHLYRLSQEAVTNALKHGRASSIEISLSDDGELITLAIADNGAGLSDEQAEGTGLRIMRYRADLIRAKLRIEQVHPHGTRVVCMLSHKQSYWRDKAAPERVGAAQEEAVPVAAQGQSVGPAV